MTILPILTVEIRYEHDVVLARQRARQVAESLGFERQDQVRLATAISELARNAYQYAKGGKVEFLLVDVPEVARQMLQTRVSDQGKGIGNLPSILSGEYVSQTGMGLGLIGAKRLMDEFDIATSKQGTTIIAGKYLPGASRQISRSQLGKIAQKLAEQKGDDPFAEIQRQNQELLATMAELEKRQQELSELNRELEDTNRGVVALYAELDQRADFLRRVSESKTRFFRA
jgi:anti-sigma regulatory factor (Ser/Thr protein kinase)